VWGEDGRFEEFVISIFEIVTGRNWVLMGRNGWSSKSFWWSSNG